MSLQPVVVAGKMYLIFVFFSFRGRSQWLSKSNRNGLSVCQLPEKNSTVHIGGQHFINGKPSVLFETTGPNWIPALMLDYKSVAIFSPEPASVQNDQRKRRWEKKYLMVVAMKITVIR